MKLILQDVNTNEVTIYDIADARMVDSEAMAYHVQVSKTTCYNTNPVFFKE